MAESREVRAERLLAAGVAYLDPEVAVYNAMLAGFVNQMKSRNLRKGTIKGRLQRVEALRKFTEFQYPWQWVPGAFEEFIASISDLDRALGTLRSYQGDINSFMTYVRDPQYGWQRECLERFGSECAQICHEGNMIIHASDYEGKPKKRNFTYDELERFFACADARYERALASGRKGTADAFRDKVLMGTIYAFVLRRFSATMLNDADFGLNPEAAQFGKYGVLIVRFGKSVRGGAYREYPVWTIPETASYAKAIEHYVKVIRPLFKKRTKGNEDALFLSERGGRLSRSRVNQIFNEIRDEAGLSEDLTLHCLRHSGSTHMTEWGYDRLFVQNQMGHSHPSTTSTYQHVSSDFKQHQIRKAVKRALQRGA